VRTHATGVRGEIDLEGSGSSRVSAVLDQDRSETVNSFLPAIDRYLRGGLRRAARA